MKILFISDLHVCTNSSKLKSLLIDENYDLIILLGDNSGYDLDIITSYKKSQIIGVLGNHDLKIDYNYYPEIKNIHNSLTVIDNMSFIGYEGSPRYKDNELVAMSTEEEMWNIVQEFPSVDFLISHCGCDYLAKKMTNNLITFGFSSFDDYYSIQKPKYHFFGHHHQDFQCVYKNVKCFCIYGVSIFDSETEQIKKLL